MRSFSDSHLHIYKYDYNKTAAFLDEILKNNVKEAAIQSLAAYIGAGVAQNLYALYMKHFYKKIKLYVFGSFQEFAPYAYVPYEKQAEHLLDMGCDGIKMIQMKPDVRKLLGKGICHPDYDKAFSMLEERNTPVLIHSGDPETFWDITKMSEDHIRFGWYYGDGTYLSSEEHYAETFARLDKNPRLNVVLAHFFFLSFKPDEARRVLEKYPNVKFDLTPGWEMYDGFAKDADFWHDFFEENSERIIFGTDDHDRREAYRHKNIHKSVYSILTHEKSDFNISTFEERPAKGLDLSDGALDKICRENFLRFAGENTSETILDRLLSEAEKMLFEIKGIKEQENSALWIKSIL